MEIGGDSAWTILWRVHEEHIAGVVTLVEVSQGNGGTHPFTPMDVGSTHMVGIEKFENVHACRVVADFSYKFHMCSGPAERHG